MAHLDRLDPAPAHVHADRAALLPIHQLLDHHHPPPRAAAVRSNSGMNMLSATAPTSAPSTIRISGSIMLVSDFITTSFSSSMNSAMLSSSGPTCPDRSPLRSAS